MHRGIVSNQSTRKETNIELKNMFCDLAKQFSSCDTKHLSGYFELVPYFEAKDEIQYPFKYNRSLVLSGVVSHLK